MDVPILKQGPYLIASIQSALETVIVGIEGVATALDLEEGLDFLKRKARDAGKQAGAPGR
jgi:hypothetical protein